MCDPIAGDLKTASGSQHLNGRRTATENVCELPALLCNMSRNLWFFMFQNVSILFKIKHWDGFIPTLFGLVNNIKGSVKVELSRSIIEQSLRIEI